jgi:hypothetical protein
MVEDDERQATQLRAQAKRARSLATMLAPGEDRRRLSELAQSLEQEAAAATDGSARDAFARPAAE